MTCRNRDELLKDVSAIAVLGGIRQDTTDLRLVAALLRAMTARDDGAYFYVSKSKLSDDDAAEVYRNLKHYLPYAQFSIDPNVHGYMLSDADILFVVDRHALSGVSELHGWAESILRTGNVNAADRVRWIAPDEPDEFTKINVHFDDTRQGAHLEQDPFGDTWAVRIPDSLRERVR